MAKLSRPNEELKSGVFIQEGIIKNVSKNESIPEPNDIDLVFEIEFTAKDNNVFTKKFFIGGKLYKNGAIPTHISNLILACGIDDLEENTIQKIVDDISVNNVTNDVKVFFSNKKIKLLSYISGTYLKDGLNKPSYKFWNGSSQGFDYINTFDINSSDEDIIKEFEVKMASNYPLKYTPEILQNNQSQSTETSDVPEVDDEDPI